MLRLLLTNSILILSLPVAHAQENHTGTFRVEIDGRPAGFERFQTTSGPDSTTITSTSETQSDGSMRKVVTSTEVRGKLVSRYDLEITTAKRSEKYSFQFTPGGIRIAIELNGKKTRRLRPALNDPVLLDRDVWHHYGFLLSRYNMRMRGRQQFRVFIPQAAFREYNAVVELMGSATFKKGSEKREGYRFKIILADGFEVIAISDREGRPFSIEVPTEETKAVLE